MGGLGTVSAYAMTGLHFLTFRLIKRHLRGAFKTQIRRQIISVL